MRTFELFDWLLVLLQVQAGIAGFALPILVFAIEAARDHELAVARIHEVLLRQTYVFPILAGALIGVLVVAAEAFLLPITEASITTAVTVLVLTLLGTLLAYYRTLRLMASRSEAKRAAHSILRERMSLGVEESALRQAMNGRLVELVRGFGLEHQPFAGLKGDAIPAQGSGIVTNFSTDALRAIGVAFAAAQSVESPQKVTGLIALNLNERAVTVTVSIGVRY
jgi:hypothetical protein